MREKLSIVGLAVFAALDVVLVALAFRSVSSSGPAQGDESSLAASSTAATSSPSPSAAPPVDKGPLVFAALLDDGTLLRASRGQCKAGTTPAVRVSAHASGPSRAVKVPGLRETLAVRAAAPHELTVVGLDTSCHLVHFTSTNLGRSWTRQQGDGGSWHLLADKTVKSVHTPGAVRPAPCADARLPQPQAGAVRLLCPDGSIYGTDDEGQSWPYLGRLPGAADIAYTNAADGLAVARQPACAAAVLRTTDSGNSWTQVVCLPGKDPTAITAQGSLVAAQVGGKVYLSKDGGTSWPKSVG